MTSRRPEFLVIGAMKSGTTTLYDQLSAQPAITMTEVKEPSILTRTADAELARRYYGRMFLHATADQRLGEASTFYSQLPRYRDVPARALATLGPAVKAIYLVRDPVERALSHHHHLVTRGHAPGGLDTVVRTDPTLIAFSRYAMQLEPWIATFGRDQVLVVRFEDLVADRIAVLGQIARFLDVAFDPAAAAGPARPLNQAEDSRSPGALRPLFHSALYTMWLRRLVPTGVRARLRRVLLRGRTYVRERPNDATLSYLVAQLEPDVAALSRLVGLSAPLWDLAATREKYLTQSRERSPR